MEFDEEAVRLAPTNEADVVPPPLEISHLPERYRSAASSGLTATITADGENFFTFSLEQP